MEKIDEVDLKQLVEEVKRDFKGERTRKAKRQIRHIIQGLEKTEKEITAMKKEIEKKEKNMTRGREKIKKVREGAWHLLSDKENEK